MQILDEVEKRREMSPALVHPFMRSVMEAPFPAPGRTITVKSYLPGAGDEVSQLRWTGLVAARERPDGRRQRAKPQDTVFASPQTVQDGLVPQSTGETSRVAPIVMTVSDIMVNCDKWRLYTVLSGETKDFTRNSQNYKGKTFSLGLG